MQPYALVTVDPAVAATVGISVGTLVLGLLLGWLLARRGRRLRFDWRVSLEAGDPPDPEAPEAPEAER